MFTLETGLFDFKKEKFTRWEKKTMHKLKMCLSYIWVEIAHMVPKCWFLKELAHAMTHMKERLGR